MRKSKLIFAAIVAIVVLVCIFTLLSSGNDNTTDESTPETIAPLPIESFPDLAETTEASYPDPTEPYSEEHGVSGIRQTHELADNVYIIQVEKDPNEVIRAYEPIGPEDPEYLPPTGENYNTAEGKVFRNDKTISIELFDELNGQDMTISFGYITGQLNRFLYLNPTVEIDGVKDPRYGFYFNTMHSGGGNVLTLPIIYGNEEDLYEAKKDANFFHVGRALDQNDIATYQDPKHPGTVWFTQAPIVGDFWIDVLVYQMGGDMQATLRLTVSKDADGTYSIVNLENKNLLQTYSEDDSVFSKEELAYLFELGKATVEDSEIVGFEFYSSTELIIERFIIEHLNEHTGLYYPYFVPANQSSGYYARTKPYADGPIIAISVRQANLVASAVTMYFRVLKSPNENEHGKYEYIGRDFLYNQSSQALYNQGYPGM